jgi:hypothetical protein
MVRRVHKYADGGKVVKDHPVEGKKTASPGLGGAIKDFIGSVGKATAPKSVTQRKSRIDKEIEDAGG